MIQTNQQEGTAGGLWKRLIVLPLCICLLTACSAHKPVVLSVGVSETERLRELLDRKRIETSFADGAQVEGRVREVQDGLLTVDVKGGVGPGPSGTGLQSVPMDRISTVRFNRHKGYRRGLFGTLFALGGLGLGTFIVAFGEGWSRNDRAVAIVTPAGAGVLGYFFGRHKEKQKVTVEIQQPDSSSLKRSLKKQSYSNR